MYKCGGCHSELNAVDVLAFLAGDLLELKCGSCGAELMAVRDSSVPDYAYKEADA